MKKKISKIVLAYSGGLDTSVIIKWLKEKYNSEIIAFCADVGQGEELDPVREKALAAGCAGYITKPIDKDTFVQEIDTVLSGS